MHWRSGEARDLPPCQEEHGPRMKVFFKLGLQGLLRAPAVRAVALIQCDVSGDEHCYPPPPPRIVARKLGKGGNLPSGETRRGSPIHRVRGAGCIGLPKRESLSSRYDLPRPRLKRELYCKYWTSRETRHLGSRLAPYLPTSPHYRQFPVLSIRHWHSGRRGNISATYPGMRIDGPLV